MSYFSMKGSLNENFDFYLFFCNLLVFLNVNITFVISNFLR